MYTTLSKAAKIIMVDEARIASLRCNLNVIIVTYWDRTRSVATAI